MMLSTLKSNTLKSSVGGHRIDIDQELIDNADLGIGILLSTIQTEIIKFCKEINIKEQRIVQSWINLNPKHAYHRKHVHSNSKVSGAYYVNVPSDSESKIRFNRSREFTDCLWSTLSLDNSIDLKPYVDYKPKTSDLILFPSFLEHEVFPNQSANYRISISFNTESFSQF